MNDLSDKIWTTRKSRIYTEKRLLQNEKLSQILTIWYSLCVVFYSIWSYAHDNSNIDLLILFAARAGREKLDRDISGKAALN